MGRIRVEQVGHGSHGHDALITVMLSLSPQVTSDTEVQARLSSDKLRWTGGVKLGLGMAFLR